MLFIASDHAGFELKEELKKSLTDSGLDFKDLGPESAERCDYPVFAEKLSLEVQKDPLSYGVLICGSGIGMSMVANRFRGVRAALCRSIKEAKLSKQHNNANVLCLGQRIETDDSAVEILKYWLIEKFESGRHQDRVELFSNKGI